MRGKAARFPSHGVLLTISHSGLYRITDTYLSSHGVNLTGAPASRLAIEHAGSPVPRLIIGGSTINHTSVIEFVAQSAPTLYSRSTTYELLLDPAKAVQAPSVPGTPGAGPAITAYTAVHSETRRTLYDPLAPANPWFFVQITAAGAGAHATDRFRLPGVVALGTAHVLVHLRGVSDEPGTGPQHHLVVALNGHRIGELRFSGIDRHDLATEAPASLLHAASNTIRFTLPDDVQNADRVDSVEIASWSLSYPRVLRATGGQLAASLPASHRVTVSNLPSSMVEIWRAELSGTVRLRGVAVRRDGSGFAVSFRAASAGRYLIATEFAMRRPSSVRAPHSTAYLLRKHAALLVIAPRALIPPLAPLLAYHRSHGLGVKVVDVQDVYDRYSFGIRDPSALRRYLEAAHPVLGFRNVLLVGADTYDYGRYLRCSRSSCPANPADRSWIPSPYVRDTSGADVPSDEWFVEAPGLPFAGIGRLPAVNAAQVRVAVTKTLALLRGNTARRETIFGAGRDTGANGFSAASDALAALVPDSYRVIRANTGRSGHAAARTSLLNGINAGALLVDFVGHGNLEQWDTSPSLLSNRDVPLLRNRSSPAIFLGWGCQTAYHVDPTDASLNARLLVAPNGGAALTLGSTGFDALPPQLELATAFFHELFHDPHVTTIGGALRRADTLTLTADPSSIHSVQDYELFGDPAMPLSLLTH